MRRPTLNRHFESLEIVLGRKNHLGSKSKRGAEVTATFYTLFESAKLCGVEPKRYGSSGDIPLHSDP